MVPYRNVSLMQIISPSRQPMVICVFKNKYYNNSHSVFYLRVIPFDLLWWSSKKREGRGGARSQIISAKWNVYLQYGFIWPSIGSINVKPSVNLYNDGGKLTLNYF